MRDLAWRIGFTLAILAALAIVALDASCSPAQHLLEQALGQTPQAQIADYVIAIAEGDRRTAPNTALATRRQSVTDD